MMGPLSSRPILPEAPRARGVTFIELLSLTIVLLILASLAAPRVGRIVEGIRLRGAAWQLAGDLRLARQRAVTTQRRFRVCMVNCKVALPAGTYSVEVEHPPVGSLKWASETGAPVLLAPEVTIDPGGGTTVTFTVGGMASGSTIILTGPNDSYTVTVASTGQVVVVQGAATVKKSSKKR